MAKKIVEKINSLTNYLRPKCSEFEFESIHAAYERLITSTGDENFKKLNVKTFLIQVIVKPGEGLFESTVKSFDNKRFEVIGDISRINSYGNQSHCIHNSFLERYCFCKG
jgi:predicted deacetylase